MTSSISECNSIASSCIEEFYTAPTTPSSSIFETPPSLTDKKSSQYTPIREVSSNPIFKKYKDSTVCDDIPSSSTLYLARRYINKTHDRYQSIINSSYTGDPSIYTQDIENIYLFSQVCRNKVLLPALLDPPFTQKSAIPLEFLDLQCPHKPVPHHYSDFLHLLPSVETITEAKKILDVEAVLNYPLSQSKAKIPQKTLQVASDILAGKPHAFMHIKKIKELGNGAYGSVNLFQDADGTHYAVKTFHENSKGCIDQKSFDEEYRHLTLIHHKHVVKLIHVDAPRHRLFLEFIEKGVINEKLPAEVILKAISQIAVTLNDLHSNQHVVHCDLKIPNILIDSEDNVKLADLGISFFRDEFDQFKEEMTPAFKYYLPYYLPPELKDGTLTSENCEKIDVWSFGILIWEFLKKDHSTLCHVDIDFITGGWKRDLLFTGFNETLLRLKLDLNKTAKIDPDGYLTNWMLRCLDANPSNRPSMNELVQHFAHQPIDSILDTY